jgi:hypothetical protein
LYQELKISTTVNGKKDPVHVPLMKEKKENSLLEQNSIT